MDYLNKVSYNKNAIPSFASLEESILFAIDSNENEYNNFMESAALEELGTLKSTGHIILYEDASENEKSTRTRIIDKLIEAVRGMFSNVSALINKFLNALKESADKFKTKISAVMTKAAYKTKVSLIDDINYGKTYDYTILTETISGTGIIWDAVNTYEKSITDICLENIEPKSNLNETLEKVSKEVEQTKITLLKSIKASSSSAASIRAAIRSLVRGNEIEINKEYISKHGQEIYDYATLFNTSSDDIKVQFKVVKQDFNNSIEIIRKSKIDVALLAKYLEALKFSKNVITIISGVVCTCEKERQATAQRIVWKVYTNTKSKDKKVQVESSTTETETSSCLFDF